MTRNDLIEIKRIDLPHALRESCPVCARNGIPDEAFLPHIVTALRAIETDEDLSQNARMCIADFRVLFCGW